MKLYYSTFEKLQVNKPVFRVDYIKEQAKDKYVLDIGCFDETSLSIKKGTGHWLHEEISRKAKYVLGIDNSEKIPKEGIVINDRSRIIKTDAYDLENEVIKNYNYDLIIAGELIEHLPNTLEYLSLIKSRYAGKQLILSTPNAYSISNVLSGMIKREAVHKDHLQIYSYKTLNTLCLRSGFLEWEIIPYHVYFTELIYKTKGINKIIIKICEKIAIIIENIFPLLSCGYIVNVTKI